MAFPQDRTRSPIEGVDLTEGRSLGCCAGSWVLTRITMNQDIHALLKESKDVAGRVSPALG